MLRPLVLRLFSETLELFLSHELCELVFGSEVVVAVTIFIKEMTMATTTTTPQISYLIG